MTYKVVRAVTVEELEEQVNELMADGWTPLGGIVEENYANTRERFMQPCVKPEASAVPQVMNVLLGNAADKPVFVQLIPAAAEGETEPQILVTDTPIVKKKRATKATKTAKKKTTSKK